MQTTCDTAENLLLLAALIIVLVIDKQKKCLEACHQ
jgi:hypothetical protein